MPVRPGDDDEADETVVGKIANIPLSTRRDRAHLIVLAGESLGQMFRVGQSEVLIGRASDAFIRLRDDGVSRHHARIVQRGGDLCIEDLESANGTLVNGNRIQRAVLHDGDKIQVGSTTILKFTHADEVEEDFQQKMHDAALYDGATKACNKRHFLHRLDVEVAYAKRHAASLSLLMLDVDRFKQINDRHGHLVGDYVLVTLAQIVQGTIRTEDLFARYGGEEFAVLCRGTPTAQALVLAERLRAKIETFLFEQNRQRIPVTVSIGIGSWLDQTDSATQLIAEADAALYEAKGAGRNRVVVRGVHGG